MSVKEKLIDKYMGMGEFGLAGALKGLLEIENNVAVLDTPIENHIANGIVDPDYLYDIDVLLDKEQLVSSDLKAESVKYADYFPMLLRLKLQYS